MNDLIFLDWGLIDYETSLQRQEALVEEVSQKKIPGYLIFCSHPPVVTLGRATQVGDVFGWNGKVVEVSRGGRATYHGPSQLVVYPILNLTSARKGRQDREIVGYLRAFEEAIVETLKLYNIEAQGRCLQNTSDSPGEGTGVWIGSRKLASLGVGVRKWVTFHGAAINLQYDPQAFSGMNPCGFTSDTMVSLEQVLNTSVDTKAFSAQLKPRLLEAL